MRARFLCLAAILGTALLLARASAAEAAIARRLEREGLQAFTGKDVATFLAKLSAAVALRPDHPRLLYHLAIAQAASAQPDDAVASLGRLADLGVYLPAETDADFTPLREREDFRDVIARLAQNRAPVGAGEIAFTLPDMPGLIEGIAWRASTGEYFFGDVHERCIWRRAVDGSVTRFSAADDRVAGVFGLAIDEARGALWAATSAVPEMRGYVADQANAAGLVEFDLATGGLRRVVLIAADGRKHVLGDLALAGNGAVFATDSVAPVIWRLTPESETLEAWQEDEEFISLQGIAFTGDGRGMFLTAYGNGLLHFDLATKTVRRLLAPPSTTLLGCDGLVRSGEGSLITVQNGVSPARVLRLALDATNRIVTRFEILEAAHPAMADVTLGCVAGGDFVFIADGGWSHFGPDATTPAGSRAVPIMRRRSR